MAEAIALVRQAGGVAAWAHPAYDGTQECLAELARLGLGAVEVEYPQAGRGRVQELRLWAAALGLAVTGGSDCHGPGRRAIGARTISDEELDRLRQKTEVSSCSAPCSTKIKQGLTRTRDVFSGIASLFRLRGRVDKDFLTALEERLLLADVGTQTTSEIVGHVRQAFLDKEISGDVEVFVKQLLKDQLADSAGLQYAPSGPTVVMVAGVNGSGQDDLDRQAGPPCSGRTARR